MSLLVTNIQRFSVYDGPGIRTTVFLKGCSLRCPWCCNPESINPYPEFYFTENKCLRKRNIECKSCINIEDPNLVKEPRSILKFNKNYNFDYRTYKKLVNSCPSGAIGIYGEKFEINELFGILIKDKEFYKTSEGGITFSGGEPLLQAKELQFILKRLKKEKINIAIETSLFCPPESVGLVKDYIDLFIIDIKILDSQECKEYLGGDIKVYYKNLEILLKNGEKNFIFRFPMIKPLTFNQENLRNLYDFIKKWQIK
ncbi:MAG: glycyl-radical enzyme activating protein, partial [Minisyncoccia bacterium]